MAFPAASARCALSGALALVVAACARVEVGGLPTTESAEPMVRVAIVTGAPTVTVGGGGALVLTAPDGGGLSGVAEGSTALLATGPLGVEARQSGVHSSPASAITARPVDTSGLVRVNGRDYRGLVLLTTVAGGLLAVNVVPLEEYVAGVVSAEMGRRPPSDKEAMLAQVVVSRTFALRTLGRYRLRGYDLVSAVSDQAYGGATSETQAGWGAVQATHGEVLTYGGTLAEVFFHSTCGGKTAAVDEAFGGTPQPYLRSIPDRAPDGRVYCALSPRFRWREEWAGEQLAQTLRETLALAGGSTAGSVADIQVTGRTSTGRVAELLLISQGKSLTVTNQHVIRQVLRPIDANMLRSAIFNLQVTRAGGQIIRLVAEGAGAGHGVGMCQWGAVGRAREGFTYREILRAYFPGTELQRFY